METIEQLKEELEKAQNINYARKISDKIQIYIKLKRLANRLNNGKKIDWSNSHQIKYSIVLDNHNLEFETHSTYKEVGAIYCLDSDFLDIAKEQIGEENLKFLIEED